MLEEAKVAYWTAALLNMALILACAWSGVRHVRRREIQVHRRRMRLAAWLVLGFLISYPIKLAALGRESLQTWEPMYRHMLRFHETCVLVMVVAGGLALFLAARLQLAREPLDLGDDPARFWARVRLHRRSGWTAIGGATLGLASAGVVLFGMFARL